MRKEEQKLWDTMLRQKKKLFKSSGMMHRRVENRITAGDPDVWWKPLGIDLCFTELKAPQVPARKSTRLFRDGSALNNDQIVFGINYSRVGGRWYCVARDSEGHLYMFSSAYVQRINEMNTEEARAASMADNWQDIFNIIAKGYA